MRRREGPARPDHDGAIWLGRHARPCRVALGLGPRGALAGNVEIDVAFALLLELACDALGDGVRFDTRGFAPRIAQRRVFGGERPAALDARACQRPISENNATIGRALLNDLPGRRGGR